MGEAVQKTQMTREAYLERERRVDDKHILWDGAVFAIAGASVAHNHVVGNLVGTLRALLRGGQCTAFPSDLKVRIPGHDRYVYPDVSVVCRPIQTEEGHEDVVLNPSLIVEVLSEGTEAFDRGDKFIAYRTIPSLRDYLLVSLASRRIEHFTRRDDGAWELREYTGDARVPIDQFRVELPLDEVYLGLDVR